MASRFNQYSSTPRDARSALFSAYDSQSSAQHRNSPSATNGHDTSTTNSRNPYGYHPSSNAYNNSNTNSGIGDGSGYMNGNATFGAYPAAAQQQSSLSSSSYSALFGRSPTHSHNHTNQQQHQQKNKPYSDAVLSELESQNDDHIEGMSAKVKALKDITLAIGDEIRDSTALAEKMNDSFEGTRLRLRSTMNRMLLMAERTGVGWRVWLGFLGVVVLLFWYVWLF